MKILLRNKPKRSSILSRVPARWTSEFRFTTIYLDTSAYKLIPSKMQRTTFSWLKSEVSCAVSSIYCWTETNLKRHDLNRGKIPSMFHSTEPNFLFPRRATSILKEITKLKHLSLARSFSLKYSVYAISRYSCSVRIKVNEFPMSNNN